MTWEQAYLSRVPHVPRLAYAYAAAVSARVRVEMDIEQHRREGRGRRRHTAKHQNRGADLRRLLRDAEQAEKAAESLLEKGMREVESALAMAARLRAIDSAQADLAAHHAAALQVKADALVLEVQTLRQWQGSHLDASSDPAPTALLRGGPGDEASATTATDLDPSGRLRGDQAAAGSPTPPS